MYLNSTSFSDINWNIINYEHPYYFFVPKDLSAKQEYEKGFSFQELFNINNSGIKTDRDTLFIHTDVETLKSNIKILLSGKLSDAFITEYRVEDSSSYKLTDKIKNKEYKDEYLQSIIYRPFDIQWIYYDPSIISRPGYGTMQHMLMENYGLYVKTGGAAESSFYI